MKLPSNKLSKKILYGLLTAGIGSCFLNSDLTYTKAYANEIQHTEASNFNEVQPLADRQKDSALSRLFQNLTAGAPPRPRVPTGRPPTRPNRQTDTEHKRPGSNRNNEEAAPAKNQHTAEAAKQPGSNKEVTQKNIIFPNKDSDTYNYVEELVAVEDGKILCNLLRQKRIELAEINGIPFKSEECTYTGPCAGTCPKCDEELAYLTQKCGELPCPKYPELDV